MRFVKQYEAIAWFRQYTPYEYSPLHTGEYSGKGVEFGDWILFQHIRSKDTSPHSYEISRPILGICMGFSVWDMALTLNIVEQPRMWICHHEVLTNPDPKYMIYQKIAWLDPEVESFPIWSDDIHEIAHWKGKPTKTQLKEALKNKIEPKVKSDATPTNIL